MAPSRPDVRIRIRTEQWLTEATLEVNRRLAYGNDRHRQTA